MINQDKMLVIINPYYDFFIKQLMNSGFRLIAIFTEQKEQEGYHKYNPEYFERIYYSSQYERIISDLKPLMIQAVVMGFDEGFDFSLQLSLDLKIKNSNPIFLKNILGNKYKTSNVLFKRNIFVAKHILVNEDNIEMSVVRASNEIGFPLIIKPTESASSYGFYICHTEEELKGRILQLLGDIDVKLNCIRELVIEEYLQGVEYSICTVSRQGKHAIPAIYQYEQFLIEGNNFIRSISLVDENNPNIHLIKKYVFDVLDALEYQAGESVTEIMLTKDGPCLIEFNPRIGGLQGHLDVMVESCTGVSHSQLAALNYTGQDLFSQKNNKLYEVLKHGKIIFLRNYSGGKVKSLESLNDLSRLSSFQAMHVPLRLDDLYRYSLEIGTSPGYVVLVNQDIVQLNRDIEFICQLERKGLFV